jgi:diaminopimelate epimerase
MNLSFTKMHGLGNDFVILDARSQPLSVDAELARRIADRRTGIGCDQLLILEPGDGEAAAGYRVFNPDGGEAEQCGNGARCIARLLSAEGLGPELVMATRGGPVRAEVLADDQVQLDMGSPQFAPEAIPFIAEAEADSYSLDCEDDRFEIGAVSLGNPHCVLTVSDVRSAPVGRIGPRLEQHRRFPTRANVGFMEVVDRGHLRLRVFERGTGETLACGTGACAAMAVARRQGLVDETVAVDQPGGRLVISWSGKGSPLYMTGPAIEVYRGEFSF